MNTTTTSTIVSDDLQDLVLSMAYDFKTVYMIVDALDEWWETNGGGLDLLLDLSRHCRRVRIFFTSRISPMFETIFHGCRSIDVAASREREISAFIQHEVDTRLSHVPVDLRDRIKATLLERARGRYVTTIMTRFFP
jgi:hypothetical protein